MKRFCPLLLLILIGCPIGHTLSIGRTLPGRQQKFYVLSLPASTGYNKAQLNREIAVEKDKAGVIRLLRSKNFPPATIVMRISTDTLHYRWWTINTAHDYPGKEKDDDNQP
jgi:hypothetical protein